MEAGEPLLHRWQERNLEKGYQYLTENTEAEQKVAELRVPRSSDFATQFSLRRSVSVALVALLPNIA